MLQKDSFNNDKQKLHHPRIELEPLAQPEDGKLVFYH